MDILYGIHEYFDILNIGEKIAISDAEDITMRGNIILPEDYRKIITSFGVPCLRNKKISSPLISFWDKAQIFDWMDMFPFFQEDLPQAFPFADDAGDYIFYYGAGKSGMGLYIVDGGAGDYREDAIMFSNSFENLFLVPEIFRVLNQKYRFGM